MNRLVILLFAFLAVSSLAFRMRSKTHKELTEEEWQAFDLAWEACWELCPEEDWWCEEEANDAALVACFDAIPNAGKC